MLKSQIYVANTHAMLHIIWTVKVKNAKTNSPARGRKKKMKIKMMNGMVSPEVIAPIAGAPDLFWPCSSPAIKLGAWIAIMTSGACVLCGLTKAAAEMVAAATGGTAEFFDGTAEMSRRGRVKCRYGCHWNVREPAKAVRPSGPDCENEMEMAEQ
jgi:hypothetical protein